VTANRLGSRKGLVAAAAILGPVREPATAVTAENFPHRSERGVGHDPSPVQPGAGPSPSSRARSRWTGLTSKLGAVTIDASTIDTNSPPRVTPEEP
jgi:hypothetical protein